MWKEETTAGLLVWKWGEGDWMQQWFEAMMIQPKKLQNCQSRCFISVKRPTHSEEWVRSLQSQSPLTSGYDCPRSLAGLLHSYLLNDFRFSEFSMRGFSWFTQWRFKRFTRSLNLQFSPVIGKAVSGQKQDFGFILTPRKLRQHPIVVLIHLHYAAHIYLLCQHGTSTRTTEQNRTSRTLPKESRTASQQIGAVWTDTWAGGHEDIPH